MKHNLLLLSILCVVATMALAQQVQLTKSSFSTYRRGPQETVADSVITIANAVLNSKDFKDSLTALNFDNPSNNCQCNSSIVLVNGRALGTDAYRELFKTLRPGLDLVFKKGSSNGGLGVTPVCTTHITSFVEAVTTNMQEISVANAIAVNVCHEYFHSLGYCHTYDKLLEPDRRPNGDAINWKVYGEDITYRIGWIVYDVLNRWINVEHTPYPYTSKLLP